MALAGFLGKFSALTPRPARARRALTGGSEGQGRIAFEVEHQLQTNWCWAAVSRSVVRFYDSTSAWTQCAIVNAEFEHDTCCGDGGSDTACNQPWYLDAALQRVGWFRTMTSTAASFESLEQEIAGGRPLCVRIGWSGGGGHFVAVAGWRVGTSGERYVDVEDPWHGRSQILFEDFCERYQGIGSWTHSYFTGAGAGGAPRLRATHDPSAIGG